MCCSLIKPNEGEAEQFKHSINFWKKLAAYKRVSSDNCVYLSEKGCAHTNYSLSHLMMGKGAFPNGADIEKTLSFYFMTCSMEADCEALAVIAATLANGGINPLTGEQCMQPETV